jgi:RNA polymerase sigma-70 factor (ECF subfamily)
MCLLDATDLSEMSIAVNPVARRCGVGALDEAEFDQAIPLHWQKVFRFILSSLRDREAAETLTQDCFLNAYRGLESFRYDCSLETWLMRIAVNLVRDYARNRRVQFWRQTGADALPVESVGASLSDGRCSPETSAQVNEELAAVWAAAATLPEKQRTIFHLRFEEDMDLISIAKATGIKEGTVKAHLFSARRLIRERVDRDQLSKWPSKLARVRLNPSTEDLV